MDHPKTPTTLPQLARMAHELNNPLTGILGYVHLMLQEAPKGSPLEADLRKIEHEAHRLEGVIQNMTQLLAGGKE